MDIELGPWTRDTDALRRAFSSAAPFEHVVIPDFLAEESAEAVLAEFPGLDHPGWFRYHNPIERKYALNALDDLPVISRLFQRFQSPEFVRLVSEVTDISDLEPDPLLHGAGLHFHPRGGKLDMHLDYSLHPVLRKERRVNLILYLNKDWDRAWGGDLQLWGADFAGCEASIAPNFNTAVLFRTSDVSYHGMPEPLTCPQGTGRKSAAVYYVSQPRAGAAARPKAEYRPVPWRPADPRLDRLYDIRRTRLIAPPDLEDWPTWERDTARAARD